jgi:hypothetical protein
MRHPAFVQIIDRLHITADRRNPEALRRSAGPTTTVVPGLTWANALRLRTLPIANKYAYLKTSPIGNDMPDCINLVGRSGAWRRLAPRAIFIARYGTAKDIRRARRLSKARESQR